MCRQGLNPHVEVKAKDLAMKTKAKVKDWALKAKDLTLKNIVNAKVMTLTQNTYR